LALKRWLKETVRSNILRSKRLLQCRDKRCISRDTEALRLRDRAFSPLIQASPRDKSCYNGNALAVGFC